MIAGNGIFGIPNFIGPNGVDKGFYGTVIAIVVAFIIGFVMMFAMKLGDEDITEQSTNKKR